MSRLANKKLLKVRVKANVASKMEIRLSRRAIQTQRFKNLGMLNCRSEPVATENSTKDYRIEIKFQNNVYCGLAPLGRKNTSK
jgi:hypothetical protein